jgi:uncharacterized RDD family membrane protein YckC
VIQLRAMLCPSCSKQNDDRALYCQSCGATMQAKVATMTEPAAAVSYAGFWVRVVALIIDFIIISVVSGLVAAITLGAGVVLSFFAPWLYEAFMLSSEWQATVGKRAMSIVVTGADGGRITFARATGRHFAKYLSACILGIGFIMAAFTSKKQALHDFIAETFVVHRPT